jgi:dephospho-CoA kinase
VHRLAAPKALAPLLVPIEKKKRMADFVIDNSGTPEETERQVRALYATLTKR